MNQALRNYLEDRYEAGRRGFEDLVGDEAEVLTGLIIASEDAATVSEVMSEGHTDFLGNLFGQYLQDSSKDSAEKFLEEFSKDVVGRYRNRIDEAFEFVGEYMREAEKENIIFAKQELRREIQDMRRAA